MPISRDSSEARPPDWTKFQIGVIKKVLTSGRILRWILLVFTDQRKVDHATYVFPYPYGGTTQPREFIAMSKCSFMTDQDLKSREGFDSITTSHMQNVTIFKDGLENIRVNHDQNINALQGGVASWAKIYETHRDRISEAMELLVVEALKTQLDENDDTFDHIADGLSLSISELWQLQKPLPRGRISLSLTVPQSKLWWQILLDLKIDHVQARRAVLLSRGNLSQNSFFDIISLSDRDNERLYEFISINAVPFPSSSDKDVWLDNCVCAEKDSELKYLYGSGTFKHTST